MQFIHYPHTVADAASNMAIDLQLLRFSQTDQIQFRHYGWSLPCWTFGYTQRWTDVQSTRPVDILECIRRPTGGGIVDHRADYTYCLIIPANHSWWRAKVCDVYAALHSAIGKAISMEGAAVRLLACKERENSASTGAEACFKRPAVSDVMESESGDKLAGAALKRSREGLLIQGSILNRAIADQRRFTDNLVDSIQQAVGGIRETAGLPERDATEIETFRSMDWNRRR